MAKLTFSFYFNQNNPLMGKVFQKEGFAFFENAAIKAEELGFAAAFYSDHLMLPINNTLLSCWSVLSALARATRKIRIGSLVTPLPLYPIYLLSKDVITVDHVSKGRAIFGVGTGWYGKEFEAYDVPFLTFKERAEKVEEAIRLFKLLCEKEESISFDGRHYKIKEAVFNPKPIQQPHPPIWTGGSSNRILRITAKHAQGWIPFEASPNQLEQKVRRLIRLLDGGGRRRDEVKIAMSFRSVISDKKKEVEEVITSLDIQREYRGPRGVINRVIAGTPEEVVEDLRRYIDVGVTHFCFGILPSNRILEGLELINDKVITQL